MKSLPPIHWMPRARKDLARCVQFVAAHPWGNPTKRTRELARGVSTIPSHPLLSPLYARRPGTGIELRRRNVAQFVVIYSYIAPTETRPRGRVSIRAIRHGNEEDVFHGVRQICPRYEVTRQS